MKGMQGLIVAAALGIVAAGLNWIYLEGQTRGIAVEEFIGVREPVPLGATIEDRHLEAVSIPSRQAEELKNYVYLYRDRGTVVGIQATKDYRGNELLARADYRTAPAELKLETGEKVMWVPVNSDSFVPDLVNPGDLIEFTVPIYASEATEVLLAPADGATESAVARVRTESIGPFRVASLGSRLASSDLARGSRSASADERLVGIFVKEEREVLDAERLQALILTGRNQSIGVVLKEKRPLRQAVRPSP